MTLEIQSFIHKPLLSTNQGFRDTPHQTLCDTAVAPMLLWLLSTGIALFFFACGIAVVNFSLRRSHALCHTSRAAPTQCNPQHISISLSVSFYKMPFPAERPHTGSHIHVQTWTVHCTSWIKSGNHREEELNPLGWNLCMEKSLEL